MDAKELLARYASGERNFRGLWLSGADLSYAKLSGADLAGARLVGARLVGAEMAGAILSGTELSEANFMDAELSGADFCSAYFSEAHLDNADLSNANFTDAVVIQTSLTCANATGANLTRVAFISSNLSGANFDGANFDAVTLRRSVLSDLNLGPLIRATVQHAGPSEFDWRTVVKSVNEPRLKDFLRCAGMPDVFAEYMIDCARSLDPTLAFSLLQSTFLSYGGPDEAFAQKLNEALEQRGVKTFFFKDDALPGERLHRVMRKGVNDHDRTILICSEASLQRPGLLNELEEALAREARDGGRSYLIPVRLDDYVLTAWAPRNMDLAQTVRDRVIADFRMHQVEAEFDAEVAKLIAVLKSPIVSG